MLQHFFNELGYTVAVVADGAVALEMLDTFQPDVVLLDLCLPDLAGEDVFTALRLRDATLPVIIITGDADVGRARQLLRRGAFDYVPKPFDFGALQRIVMAASRRAAI